MLKLKEKAIPTKITKENVEILITGDSADELIKDIDFAIDRLVMIRDFLLTEK